MLTRHARHGRRTRLRAALLTALALMLAGPVVTTGVARADDSIPELGANDVRSDGILLPHASYSGAGDLDLLASTGARLYRARVRMDCVDPQHTGDYDFGGRRPGCSGVSYDDLVRNLARRGTTLLPALINFGDTPGGYLPVPPTVDGAGGSPTRAQFAAFAAAVARRYGPNGSFWPTCGCDPQPIKAWEIWNEANNGWWWGGRADAADYAGMFADTRAALRAADPQARAVVGGLVWDPNGQASFVAPEQMIAALAATNANAFDAVAIHPYTDGRAQGADQLASAALTYVAQAAQAVRDWTGAAADGSPRQQIWVTEMGWSDADAAPDAVAGGLHAFLAGLDAGQRTRDNVGPVLWYMLRDSAYRTGRDDQLGMRLTTDVGVDAGPKPVWSAFAAFAARGTRLPLPPALPDTGPAPRPQPAAAAPSRESAPKKQADARVVVVRASAAKGGALSLRVTCVDATTSCRAAVRLQASVARAGRTGHTARSTTTVVGRRSLKVAGGRTATFRVVLSRAGAAALKRQGRMRVAAVVTASDLKGRSAVRTTSATLAHAKKR